MASALGPVTTRDTLIVAIEVLSARRADHVAKALGVEYCVLQIVEQGKVLGSQTEKKSYEHVVLVNDITDTGRDW